MVQGLPLQLFPLSQMVTVYGPSRCISYKSSPFVVLLLLAFILRLIYLIEISKSPFSQVPVVDARTYDQSASGIISGDWPKNEPFWQPPLYPYFLALIYNLFGENYGAVRIIQHLLGSLSVVLLYLIAKEVFGKEVALIASFIACFYPLFIYFEGELLIPSLTIFLYLLLLLSLLRAYGFPDFKKWLISGLILGISAIARPDILLFVPFVLLCLWSVLAHGLKAPKSVEEFLGEKSAVKDALYGKLKKRHILLWSSAFLLGVILPILPVTSFNYIVGKDLVLISSNVGINFYLGNNPDYDRTTGIRPGPRWDELGNLPANAGLTKPSDKSSFFLSKSWDFISDEPYQYFKLLLKKSLLFWGGDEIKRNQDIYYSRRYSHLLSILLWKRLIAFPFGIVCPLALLGMIIAIYRYWGQVGPLLLLLFVLSYSVSVIAFFVTSRYRLPVVPILLVFAAYTIRWWYEKIKNSERKALLASFAPFCLFLFVSNSNIPKMNPEGDAEIHYHLGFIYTQKEMHAKAASEYKKAVDLQPDYIQARENLAAAYSSLGMLKESAAEYERVIENGPPHLSARYSLGSVFLAQKMINKALEEYNKIIQIDSLQAEAFYSIGSIYTQKGMYKEAVEYYKKAIFIEPDHLKFHLNLAFCYDRLYLYDEAIHHNKRALEIDPLNIDALNRLGVAYAQKRMLGKAKSYFEKAIEIDTLNVHAYRNLALVLKEMEMYDEAIRQCERALQIDPNFFQIHYDLSVLYSKKKEGEKAQDQMNTYLFKKRRENSLKTADELTERLQQVFGSH